MTIILVDSDKKLNSLLSQIEEFSQIGLDTEFIRESTYRPILVPIQISLPNDEIYLIDPKEIKDKSGLSKMLSDGRIMKIIHSAKQDLEALYSYTDNFCVIYLSIKLHLISYLKNLMLHTLL